MFEDLGGGRAVQWGIVSFGGTCGRSHSGYTDVAALRGWIDDGVVLLTQDRLTAWGELGRGSVGSHWLPSKPAG